jgi:hypothetical protein
MWHRRNIVAARAVKEGQDHKSQEGRMSGRVAKAIRAILIQGNPGGYERKDKSKLKRIFYTSSQKQRAYYIATAKKIKEERKTK